MPNKQPPVEHRFSATNPPPPRPRTARKPYLTPLLRRLLEKKIKFEDPETRKMIEGKVKHAVIWRLLLNATQGDNQAIKEILDRMDGKVIQQLIGEGFGDTKIIILQRKEGSARKILDGELSG